MWNRANHFWINWRARSQRKRPFCQMCCRSSGHPSRRVPCSCNGCRNYCRHRFGQHFCLRIRLKWELFYRRSWIKSINSMYFVVAERQAWSIINFSRSPSILIRLCFFFVFISCNSTAKPPTTIKVLLVGGDWLQGAVLRHYVDLLAVRPPDWVNHIRFYIVPICKYSHRHHCIKIWPNFLNWMIFYSSYVNPDSSSISRHLSAIDNSYATIFGNDNWTQLCESAASLDPAQAKSEIQEIVNRIQRYLHTAGPCTQIPIAEAMVNYKDEDSCQIFVPFVCVRY